MKTTAESPEINIHFLIEHLAEIWDHQKSLKGVTLPEGVNPMTLWGEVLKQKGARYLDLCDAILVMPGGLKTTDQLLSELPPETPIRALVPHGTPGSTSLHCCPEGTLTDTTIGELQKRIAEGLRVLSIMTR